MLHISWIKFFCECLSHWCTESWIQQLFHENYWIHSSAFHKLINSFSITGDENCCCLTTKQGHKRCTSLENKRLILHNHLPVPGPFLSSLLDILIRHALVCFIVLEWRLTVRIKQGDEQLNQTISGTTLKLSRVILGYYHVMSPSYFHPVICHCVSLV